MPIALQAETPTVVIPTGRRAEYRIDPLNDPRWGRFIENHPRASMFHSLAWLSALERTYKYRVVAYTTCPPGEELQDAIVFCRVDSWLTGRRLVSLPFSDHCEPLVDRQEDVNLLVAAVENDAANQRWRYVELRPLTPLRIETSLLTTTVNYSFHTLDLRPDLEQIFRNFHKDSIQRKVRRAEREQLQYDEGTTDRHLGQFYRLFIMTRRRHGLPAQPRKWFENLVSGFGDALKVRIALKDDRPVAAMVTVRFKDTLVYKYGCSDTRYNNLGGMPMLFWTSIQDAKAAALKIFDFGRTDAGQSGLIRFKNKFGTTESALTYTRLSIAGRSTHAFDLPGSQWKHKASKRLLTHMPGSLLSAVGRILYKHIG